MKELVIALEKTLKSPAPDRPMGETSKKSKVTSLYIALSLKVMEDGLTFDDVIPKELQKELIDYLGFAQKQEA
ncbi:TPA: hypothetical protein G8N92_005103 [Salmonella enterica]|nr:hypothetical protein [Salmonella enterica]